MRIYHLRLLLGLVISASFACSRPSLAQDSWQLLRQKVKDSVIYLEVTKQNRDGTNREVFSSTGFIISDRGALTVAHAVPSATSDTIVHYNASVKSRHAHKFPFEVIMRDNQLDLALLAFPDVQIWSPIEFGESAPVPEDAELYVLGFPRDSDLASAFGRLSSRFGPGGYWQTTLPLDYGNSGGPVFDIGGKVIGIAAGGRDEAKAMTFVIPADYARPLRSLVRAALAPTKPNWTLFTFMKSVDHQQAADVDEVFCLPAGKKVVSFKPEILSKNGQDTRLVSAATVPGRPNCVDFKAYVAGNGVERYGSIVVDHKGRGWLSGYVAVYGN